MRASVLLMADLPRFFVVIAKQQPVVRHRVRARLSRPVDTASRQPAVASFDACGVFPIAAPRRMITATPIVHEFSFRNDVTRTEHQFDFARAAKERRQIGVVN